MKTTHYEALSPRSDAKVLKNRWHDIVREYTSKSLTFPQDAFPALAGLAKQMQSRRGSAYYAGLWEDTLSSDLLWTVRYAGVYESERSDTERRPRPSEWRAPTCSWASITAPVSYAKLG